MGRVAREHYPHLLYAKNLRIPVGDFGAGIEVALQGFDKRSWLDWLSLQLDALSTGAAVIRFGYANSGQTLDAAAGAGQWLTDTIALHAAGGDLTAAVQINSESNPTIFNMAGYNNGQPFEFAPGRRLFVQTDAVVTGASDFLIGFGIREAAQ